MKKAFFIGVDGGATKCIVRVEDNAGHLVGRETTGPANIRLSVDDTWQSIYQALHAILTPHDLKLDSENCEFHIGMGLAGTEVLAARDAFIKQPHPFKTLTLTSDAHIACLGAHPKGEGAIISIGTGVIGYQIKHSQIKRVGGFGFPHDDSGGGAWLGLQAMKATLCYLDGRMPTSGIAINVYSHFANDSDRLIAFSNSADSTAWARLAPLVLKQAEIGDIVALDIVQRAAAHIDAIERALSIDQSTPYALLGGLAPFMVTYIGDSLRQKLIPPRATPDVGALLLARQNIG